MAGQLRLDGRVRQGQRGKRRRSRTDNINAGAAKLSVLGLPPRWENLGRVTIPSLLLPLSYSAQL
jgi:hypothetical protein